jgi:hypothetical protein
MISPGSSGAECLCSFMKPVPAQNDENFLVGAAVPWPPELPALAIFEVAPGDFHLPRSAVKFICWHPVLPASHGPGP